MCPIFLPFMYLVNQSSPIRQISGTKLLLGIFRDSYGSGVGIVWEAYHKGVPLLGVPENPIDVKIHQLSVDFVAPEWFSG